MDSYALADQDAVAEAQAVALNCAWGDAFMPLLKVDGDGVEGGPETHARAGEKFPPEALSYDTDISDRVISRVQGTAKPILDKEEWVVIEGVDDRRSR